MTDKSNYTGRLEDIVLKAQEMQEELRSIKRDFLNDKHRTHTPTNKQESTSHAMVIRDLDNLIEYIDPLTYANIMFNIT